MFDVTLGSLEPAVTEPSLQQMYRASYQEGLARAAQQMKAARHVSGAITLRGAAGTAVTFSVDGEMAGMVNTAPYDFPGTPTRSRTAGIRSG